MKRNKIIIYLNSTTLSHIQFLQKDFLVLFSKKFDLHILSHSNLKELKKIYNLKNIKFITLNNESVQKINNSRIYKFIKNVKLQSFLKKNHTIRDFHKIFINKILKSKKIFILLKPIYLLSYLFLRFLLCKFSFVRKLISFYEEMFYFDKEALKVIKKIKPKLLLTASPGWWDYDKFLLNSAKKSKVKTCSIILSWDQTTGLGLLGTYSDYYLAWTTIMKKELINYHRIQPEKIFVTGCIYWDFHFNKNYSFPKNIFCKKYRISKYKKIILISLKSPTRTRYDEVKNFIIYLENKFKAKFHFLIRPHPIYFTSRFEKDIENLNLEFKNNKNITVQNYLKIPNQNKNDGPKSNDLLFVIKNLENQRKIIYNTLQYSCLMINFFSTQILEAAIHDTPSINYIYSKNIKYTNTSKKKNLYMDLAQEHIKRVIKYNYSQNCFENKELILSINKIIKNKKKLDMYKKELIKNEIQFLDGKNINRCLESINHILTKNG